MSKDIQHFEVPNGQALRDQDERFHYVALATRDAIYDWDIRTGAVWRNETYQEFYSPSEPVGTNETWWEQHLHPDDRQRVVESIAKSLEDGSHFWSDEYRFLRFDGSYATVIDRGYILYDDRGQPARMIGAITDITERKQVEQTLSENEQRYKLLFHRSPVGIFNYDDKLRITEINERFEQLIQAPRERLIGLDLNELKDRSVLPCLMNVLEGEEGFYEGVYHATTSPVVLFISMRAVPLYNERGEIQGGIGIVEDITERKRAEETLRHSEARHRSLVENLNDVVFTLDAEGRFTYISPSIERVSGHRPHEVVGQPFAHFAHPEDLPGLQASFLRTLEGEVGPSEFRIFDRRGAVRWVRTSSRPQFDHDQLIGLTGILTDITESKQGESLLQESEQRFRSIFEHAAAGMAIITPEGRFLQINPAYCKMLGYSEAELLQMTVFEITHPEDREGARRRFSEILGGQRQATNIEKRYLCKDGTTLWGYVTAVTVVDADMKPLYMLSLVQDITERRRAESLLRESEQRFRTIFNEAGTGISLLDLVSGAPIQNNRALQMMFGCSHDDLSRLETFDELTCPEDRERDAVLHRELREGKRDILRQEKHFILRDGRHAWANVIFTLLRDSEGRPRYVIGMHEDITERKRAEEALRESEERYRRFFEEDLAGDYISTPDGKILACNSAFARIFGFDSIEEAIELGVESLYPDPKIRETFLDLLRNQRRLEYYEEELRRKDGSSVNVIENAIGTFDEKGELIEIRGYLIDDTERRKVEQQLRQSQKLEAVGRLAGGIAHDFNNLLTAILGYSEILLGKIPHVDPTYRQILEIKLAGDRAASLTRQLLAFSRKQILQPRVLDLNSVIADLDKMLRRIIGEDIDLITIFDPSLDYVKADPGQIEQVIVNLVVNARDAMPRGGRLTIETANVYLDEEYAVRHVAVKPGPYIMVDVSDTGCGLDAQTQSHIFEPFFTTKEAGKGSGLGLSTVYGIVKQSGGYIWVYSEEGRGASFKIYLPRVDEAPASLSAAARSSPLPRGTETVLLAEDEPLVRKLAGTVLRQAGYTVLEASNGEEALQVAADRSVEIDLLVTDMVMPQMGGKELAERIKAARPDIKMIFMSGYTDNVTFQHRLPGDGSVFIQKPFTPSALTHKVREVLDASRR